MATILQLKVAKRRLFEKVSLERCYAPAREGTRDEVGTVNVRTSPTWGILANFEYTAPGMGSLNSSKEMLESTVDTTSLDQRARKEVTRVT